MAASFTWKAPLDPREIKDYDFDIEAEMIAAVDTLGVDPGSVTWALSAQAIAAGVIIHASTHTETLMVVWLKVDPLMADDVMFDGPGTGLDVNFTATTTGGRKYHRSGTVTVKHL
jgi:hypothetical protein